MAKTGFRIDVTELGDLADDLAAAGGLIGPIAGGVQRKYGAMIVKEAKRLVPVRTGALKRSIRMSDTGEAFRLGLTNVTIEADTSTETGRNYAGYVEFGTSRMAPRPYIRPALRKYAKPYREELIDSAARLMGTKGAARLALKGKSLYRGGSSFSLPKALGRMND